MTLKSLVSISMKFGGESFRNSFKISSGPLLLLFFKFRNNLETSEGVKLSLNRLSAFSKENYGSICSASALLGLEKWLKKIVGDILSDIIKGFVPLIIFQ